MLTLIHPKTMTVDDVGDLLSQLRSLGLRSGATSTVTDTELLARAVYGDGQAQDLVVINGASGGAYSRRGEVGEAPISESVPRLVADAGVMSTVTIALGNSDQIRQVVRVLEHTQVRPKQCSASRLASLVFDPTRPVNLATTTVAPTVADTTKKSWAGALVVPLILVILGFVAFSLFGGGRESVDSAQDLQLNDVGERIGGNAAGPGGELGYAYWVEPTVGDTPEPLSEGATIPERIGHYFRPFDPVPLLNSMPRCFDGGGTGVDNLHLYCIGKAPDFDAFAAANGMPPLASEIFGGTSTHFSYTRLNDPGWYGERAECTSSWTRIQLTDPRYFAYVTEPCDENQERYEGTWPIDKDGEIVFQDRTRGVMGKDGTELFPQLRIDGFNSRESIDAFVEFYGIDV